MMATRTILAMTALLGMLAVVVAPTATAVYSPPPTATIVVNAIGSANLAGDIVCPYDPGLFDAGLSPMRAGAVGIGYEINVMGCSLSGSAEVSP